MSGRSTCNEVEYERLLAFHFLYHQLWMEEVVLVLLDTEKDGERA